MIYVVHSHGSPLREFRTLAQAQTFMAEEFDRRWPRAIYGTQEAAARGLTVVGKPELTPEEARELRAGLERA